MTPRTVYYDNQNHRVELGDLLASGTGGEGKVFKVVGQPSSVAKIYHDPSHADREKKLEKMLTLPRPDPRTLPGRRRPCIKHKEGGLSAS